MSVAIIGAMHTAAVAEPILDTESTDSAATVTSQDVAELPLPSRSVQRLTIFGSRSAVADAPGSGFYVGADDIRQQNYDDVNRALRKAPGVYLREEDGFGLFPNISLRGVDTSRSAKVTLMEDGILTAPAPYSAPEAYYAPTAGRMEAIEVLKGSSQIQYGPHTTGGVINYLSTSIPENPSFYLKTTYGSFQDVRVHAYAGGTFDLDQAGTWGVLFENYYRSNEGFKDVDRAPNANEDNTGLEVVEPMFKVSWEPDSDVYNRFEFKIGYTDRDANETYLGLEENDFNRDPYRRYAASRFDEINTWHTRMYLNHYMELTEELSINSTAYYNRFHRNWYKLNDLRNIDTDGDGMGDGVNQGLSPALAGAGMGVGLDVLRGDRAGDLRVRANDRDYYSYGFQVEPTYLFRTGELEHRLQTGVRYHVDRIRQFQRDDIYEQDSSGALADNDGDGIALNIGEPGSGGNARQQTQAVAVFAKDAISFGKFTVTPGIRFEQLWLEFTDFEPNASNTVTAEDDGCLSVLGGGVGVTYDWTEQVTLFGGVHRGFSPPSPGAHLKDGLEEETSLAFELGARYQSPRGAFRAEALGFYTMFDDLIVIDNQGGSGSGDGRSENVGKVDSVGVELLLEYDAGLANDWGVSMPNFLSFTYTCAELGNDSDSADAESIFAGGKKGNMVPYIPEYVLTLGTGLDFGRCGGFVTGSFVSEMFSTAGNTDEQLNADGDPDARFGMLDSHFVVDVSAFVRIHDNAKIVGGVHNLFDEEYIGSRHPHGPRPGISRFAYIGMEINF